MGKGVEDTAFYRWTRFIALNEVGGRTGATSASPCHDFHDAMRERLRGAPRGR